MVLVVLILVLFHQQQLLYLFQEKERSFEWINFQSNSFLCRLLFHLNFSYIYILITLKTFKILRLLIKGRSNVYFHWKRRSIFHALLKLIFLVWVNFFCIAWLFIPDWSKVVTLKLFEWSTSLFELWSVWYQHIAFSVMNVSMKRLLGAYFDKKENKCIVFF